MPQSQRAPSDPRLINQKVFSEQKLIAGIPHLLFLLIAILGFGGVLSFIYLTGFLLGSILGVLFLMLLFKPLKAVHQNDPKAGVFLIEALRRSPHLTAQYTVPKSIKVLKSGTVFDLHTLQLKDY